MTLRVVPEGLTAAGSAVESPTARLAAAHTAAAPLVNAVIPPAADPVSLQTAAGLSAHGSAHSTVASLALEELGRAGMGVTQSAASYASGDAQAAASYLIARGG